MTIGLACGYFVHTLAMYVLTIGIIHGTYTHFFLIY